MLAKEASIDPASGNTRHFEDAAGQDREVGVNGLEVSAPVLSNY